MSASTPPVLPDARRLLDRLGERVDQAPVRQVHGRIQRISGLMVYAALDPVGIGELCYLRDPLRGQQIPAEVVGFAAGEAILSPIGPLQGLSTRAEVIATGQRFGLSIGPWLLGRVIDPLGQYLDASPTRGPAPPQDSPASWHAADGEPPAALARQLIEQPMSLGVRAIDGLVTVARGQRVGIFGEPGAGKSMLLSSIVRHSDADVIVLGLIGERGREVRELLDVQLNAQLRSRTVAVVSTSDRPAIERAKAAAVATRVAEYFRDQGQNVLLLMDSVTRFARAQREIGLAAGEPPTRRGYPPSLFAALPSLLERAGPGAQGTITGLYTVLTEGDAALDPVAEEVRSILDGHIVLSPELARANHFPAIDVLASRSRLMDSVVSSRHRRLAGQLRRLMARYQEIELLLRVGEYSQGTDAETDRAIDKHDAIQRFLRQAPDEPSDIDKTVSAMRTLLS